MGFRISAPLLSPLLCNRGCGHIYFTPDRFGICGGALVLVDSARTIRNVRSCDLKQLLAALPSRQVFFNGTRYPVPPTPNGVLTILCAVRRGGLRRRELDSPPQSWPQAVPSIETPFQSQHRLLRDVSSGLGSFPRFFAVEQRTIMHH